MFTSLIELGFGGGLDESKPTIEKTQLTSIVDLPGERGYRGYSIKISLTSIET